MLTPAKPTTTLSMLGGCCAVVHMFGVIFSVLLGWWWMVARWFLTGLWILFAVFICFWSCFPSPPISAHAESGAWEDVDYIDEFLPQPHSTRRHLPLSFPWLQQTGKSLYAHKDALLYFQGPLAPCMVLTQAKFFYFISPITWLSWIRMSGLRMQFKEYYICTIQNGTLHMFERHKTVVCSVGFVLWLIIESVALN